MMIYLRPSFQITYVGIVWCILGLPIDITGAAGPKLNVREEWVLLSSEANITPLEITCTGDKKLEWEWGYKAEDTVEEYYKIKNNDVLTGFSSTLIIEDPYPMDTGNFTCKYSETGESVTTYVYVNDNKTNFVNGDTYEFLQVTIDEPIVLDCRTTQPDITIKVYRDQNKDVTDQFNVYRHNVFSKVAVSSKESGFYSCKGANFADESAWSVTIYTLPKPMIQEYHNAHYVVGKDFSLNCSLHSNHKENIKLIRKYPNKHTILHYKNLSENDHNGNFMVKTLIIKNATLEDNGNYTCIARRGSEEKTNIKHIDIKETLNSFVEIDSKKLKMAPLEEHDTFQWILYFRAYPENITYQFFNPSGTLLTNEMERVSTTFDYHLGMISLKIRDVRPKDFGNYTLVMSNINGDSDSTSVTAIVNGLPIVEFDEKPETYPAGSSITLTASILSFDNKNSSSVSWYFTDNCPSGMNSCVEFQQEDELPNNIVTQMGPGISNSIQSAVTFFPKKSGKVRCKIQNYYGINYTDSIIYVSDIGGTFVLKVTTQDNKLIPPKNGRVTLVQGDKVNIICAVLDFTHTNVYLHYTSGINELPPCNRSTLSSGICIENSVVTLNMNGSYRCIAESKLNGEISSEDLNIEVLPLTAHELLGSSLTTSGSALKVAIAGCLTIVIVLYFI